MAEHVCPWWLGYLLASPIRRWLTQSPEEMLGPFVREGSVVLEPGPGMGFFTLPLARMVGSTGRVVAVDIQPKMLAELQRRAARNGVANRIDARLVDREQMRLNDLKGAVDFCLAFAVVHELPSASSFFNEVALALKPGGLMFLAEPSGHVKAARFQEELDAAHIAGLGVVSRPTVSRNQAAVLQKAAN
jgi:2-polyprenyl-3-methyl-5-hydroxy-6-metoxy-1,4-benzoquinol methylase